jgi:4-alpha-glucanotransferase
LISEPDSATNAPAEPLLRKRGTKTALVLSAHQPVGNLTEGVKEAIKSCYWPALIALERFGELRFNLHLSGALLDWLEQLEPELLTRFKAMRSRIEFLAGAAYQPLLSLAPREDVLGQFKWHQAMLNRWFDAQARGAWVTSMAWEPHLPELLHETGLEYTVLPQALFERVNRTRDNSAQKRLFSTEDRGKSIRVFSADAEHLPTPDHEGICVVKLEDLAGRLDWFEALLEQCTKREAMRLSTWSDATPRAPTMYLPNHEPVGRSSWRELLHTSSSLNHLHKRGQYASKKLNAVFRVPDEAYRHLWRAQEASPLTDGGANLNYLRFEAYRNLIRAENMLEPRKYAWLEIDYRDLDLDGIDEIIAEAHTMNVYFDASSGGGIRELDDRLRVANLCDAHRGPLSLTEHFLEPEATTVAQFAAGTHLELGDFADAPFEGSRYRDRVTMTRVGTVRGPSGTPVEVEIKKAVRILPKEQVLEVEYQILNRGDWDIVTRFGSLWNFALLAERSTERQFMMNGQMVGDLSLEREHRNVQTAGIRDAWLGLEVTLDFGRELTVWTHPVYEGEHYQSSVVLPLWDLDVPKKRSRRLEYTLKINAL